MHSKDEPYFDELIHWVLETKPTQKKTIHRKKLDLCQKYRRKHVPTDIEVYMQTPKEHLKEIQPYLKSKPIRTGSGVAVIATMSMPSVCPHGACTFCPGGIGSVYGDVPMSYTGKEPSTMRGIRNEWDPYRIIFNRLQQFVILGQHPDKVDQIIQGGTFPSFDPEYQEKYCYYSFKAYNDFSKEFYDEKGELQLDYFKEFFELPCKVGNKERQERIKEKILHVKYNNETNLEEEQITNELAVIRCIGLTIETKPDWGFKEHGLDFLRLGATRVELGVQTVYDDILQAVNRGHTLEETHKSVAELKDLCFKLNFHLMPGLPTPDGSRISKERDIHAIKEIFENQQYKPDMIKIYPCMVMPDTPLEKTYKSGIYKPLSTDEARDIIVEAYKIVPEWCRLMRVLRDIPTFATTAGVDRTNLRQYADMQAKQEHILCRDIRSREIMQEEITGIPHLVVRKFQSSGCNEYFISVESNDRLLGFVRLRMVKRSLHDAITPNSGLIRELHVYGQAIPIGKTSEKAQHRGFGRILMQEAENICLQQQKDKIVVISGVGVREYYKKIGYEKEGPFMVKWL